MLMLMYAVETGQMSAAETGQMSAVAFYIFMTVALQCTSVARTTKDKSMIRNTMMLGSSEACPSFKLRSCNVSSPLDP